MIDIIQNLLDLNEQIIGDINQDGILNVLDVILMINIILFDNNYDELADLNGDDIINILDIIVLVSMILDR